jgi:hypothetical protein
MLHSPDSSWYEYLMRFDGKQGEPLIFVLNVPSSTWRKPETRGILNPHSTLDHKDLESEPESWALSSNRHLPGIASSDSILSSTTYLAQFKMAEPSSTASTSTAPAESAPAQAQDGKVDKKEPVVIICIGMAGSVSIFHWSHCYDNRETL